MAHEVSWLPIALSELHEIVAYIAEDSPSAAASVLDRMMAMGDDLAEFPLMGPRVPEWDDDDYRQRIAWSYRLIYRVRADDIQIIAVWHGARLLPNAIRRRT